MSNNTPVSPENTNYSIEMEPVTVASNSDALSREAEAEDTSEDTEPINASSIEEDRETVVQNDDQVEATDTSQDTELIDASKPSLIQIMFESVCASSKAFWRQTVVQNDDQVEATDTSQDTELINASKPSLIQIMFESICASSKAFWRYLLPAVLLGQPIFFRGMLCDQELSLDEKKERLKAIQEVLKVLMSVAGAQIGASLSLRQMVSDNLTAMTFLLMSFACSVIGMLTSLFLVLLLFALNFQGQQITLYFQNAQASSSITWDICVILSIPGVWTFGGFSCFIVSILIVAWTPSPAPPVSPPNDSSQMSKIPAAIGTVALVVGLGFLLVVWLTFRKYTAIRLAE